MWCVNLSPHKFFGNLITVRLLLLLFYYQVLVHFHICWWKNSISNSISNFTNNIISNFILLLCNFTKVNFTNFYGWPNSIAITSVEGFNSVFPNTFSSWIFQSPYVWFFFNFINNPTKYLLHCINVQEKLDWHAKTVKAGVFFSIPIQH